MENQEKNNRFLSVSIIIAAVLISGSLLYSIGIKGFEKNSQTAEVQKAVQKSAGPQIDDDVILGDPEAPVTVFVFSDYQCPFCGKFFKETESLIRENYVETGKAKMVFKDLAFVGPESTLAAQAAECARDQQKYWAFHDALFNIEVNEFETLGNNENNGNLNEETFKNIASNLGMDVGEFLTCFESQKYAAEVENDFQEAGSIIDKISTPTIFIDKTIIQGAYPYSVFAQLIDEALKQN